MYPPEAGHPVQSRIPLYVPSLDVGPEVNEILGDVQKMVLFGDLEQHGRSHLVLDVYVGAHGEQELYDLLVSNLRRFPQSRAARIALRVHVASSGEQVLHHI